MFQKLRYRDLLN